jgi:hypothetical protein
VLGSDVEVVDVYTPALVDGVRQPRSQARRCCCSASCASHQAWATSRVAKL